MEISGIDHVVVKVSDLERSIHFYCDILGCKLQWRRDELSLAHLCVGASFVDLLEDKALSYSPGQNMDHLCLTVTDFNLQKVRSHFLAHGIELGTSGDRFGASGWGQSLYISDPDGNGLELRG